MKKREVMCLMLAVNMLTVSGAQVVQADQIQQQDEQEEYGIADMDESEPEITETEETEEPDGANEEEKELEESSEDESESEDEEEPEANELVIREEEPEKDFSENTDVIDVIREVKEDIKESEAIFSDPGGAEAEEESEDPYPGSQDNNIIEESFSMEYEEPEQPETLELPLNTQAEQPKQQPQITIENTGLVSANGIPITPSIRISGSSLDESKLDILILDENGRPVENYGEFIKNEEGLSYVLSEIYEDGIYTLHITGSDGEGNPIEAKYVFSVNKKGTSFRYDRQTADQYLDEMFSPEIELQNIDEIMVLACMNNGKDIAYYLNEGILTVDQNGLCTGKNRITLEVRDGAGNISVMQPWEFYIAGEDQTVPKDAPDQTGSLQERPVSGGVLPKTVVGRLLNIFGKTHV